jgi:RNA polymerase sigma factor (sigma-70 family)
MSSLDKEIGKHLEALADREENLSEEEKENFKRWIRRAYNLIPIMAHKYKRNRVEYDDLVQEALIGLAFAIKDFRRERAKGPPQDAFHTYAIYRMKGRMYDFCITNETPIHVPSQVAKAASYVKQMKRLLNHVPVFSENTDLIDEIIKTENHVEEEKLNAAAVGDLKELKRKLGRIAHNSKINYEKLAAMALQSITLIVSDDILSKFPRDGALVDEIVSSRELSDHLKDSLGEKRFTVLYLRALGWNLREIAETLKDLGYTNRQGDCVSRQAVKGILDETLKAIEKMRLFSKLSGLFNSLKDKE